MQAVKVIIIIFLSMYAFEKWSMSIADDYEETIDRIVTLIEMIVGIILIFVVYKI